MVVNEMSLVNSKNNIVKGGEKRVDDSFVAKAMENWYVMTDKDVMRDDKLFSRH